MTKRGYIGLFAIIILVIIIMFFVGSQIFSFFGQTNNNLYIFTGNGYSNSAPEDRGFIDRPTPLRPQMISNIDYEDYTINLYHEDIIQEVIKATHCKIYEDEQIIDFSLNNPLVAKTCEGEIISQELGCDIRQEVSTSCNDPQSTCTQDFCDDCYDRVVELGGTPQDYNNPVWWDNKWREKCCDAYSCISGCQLGLENCGHAASQCSQITSTCGGFGEEIIGVNNGPGCWGRFEIIKDENIIYSSNWTQSTINKDTQKFSLSFLSHQSVLSNEITADKRKMCSNFISTITPINEYSLQKSILTKTFVLEQPSTITYEIKNNAEPFLANIVFDYEIKTGLGSFKTYRLQNVTIPSGTSEYYDIETFSNIDSVIINTYLEPKIFSSKKLNGDCRYDYDIVPLSECENDFVLTSFKDSKTLFAETQNSSIPDPPGPPIKKTGFWDMLKEFFESLLKKIFGG